MKVMFTLIAIILLIGAGIYYFGIEGYDPDAQGAAARAAVTPGMTWEQVIGATKAPRHYHAYIEKEDDGEKYIEQGPRNKFDPQSFKKRYDAGALSHGFIFEYAYSAKTAFYVEFDGSGNSVGTSDMPTMADLLQTR